MVSGGRNATFLFAIRFDLKITKSMSIQCDIENIYDKIKE